VALQKWLAVARRRPLAKISEDAYKNSINLLAKDAGTLLPHQIKREHILDFLADDEWAPATQAHHLRNLGGFFRWAEKSHHIGTNPTADIPQPENEEEVEILTPGEASSLLKVAGPEMLPALAICLFAGLRTSEVRRLSWEETLTAAGWRDAKGKSTWPRNAMRHSYGTYRMAVVKYENLVAAEMGNSPEMIHKHYRRVVPKSATQDYWSITTTPSIESW
jgi:site-specific recombinase XerD